MNLYLISQDENNSYDTYDSCVVCAGTEEEARNINPEGDFGEDECWSAWCRSPELVKVELIGKAEWGVPKGIILSSFNAG